MSASNSNRYLFTFFLLLATAWRAPAQVNFTSSNLPIVVIYTHGRSIVESTRIEAFMGVIDHGEGLRNRIDDPFDGYDGRIAIELRGSASAAYPKKQYRFETQDSLGNNLNVELLGLLRENDWIFYGPYDDQSLIRNVLAYNLSLQIGRYASRTRFCELVLNDDYQGLYVLMEKIKRDRRRVDVTEMDTDDTAGDSLTGGYIIKIDKNAGENVDGWRSSMGILYQYHYPKADDIVQEQQDYIRRFMNDFEAIMNQTDFDNSETGYPRYLNIDSFVDHFILNEFCKNVDAYRISAFLYKDRDSKDKLLYAGPIWDFNLSFGKAWFDEDLFVTEGWQVDYRLYRPWDGFQVPFWWEKLGHDSGFLDKVKVRWRELRRDVITTGALFSTIDTWVDSLQEARIRNFQRWPGSEKHPYDEEIEHLKEWIIDRLKWMDQQLDYDVIQQVVYNPISTPDDFRLYQNYPNPFNSSTAISYLLDKPAHVQLLIYALDGKLVRRLLEEKQNEGEKRVIWDGRNDLGYPVSSGLYLCQLFVGDQREMIKMILTI
jgi:hypothetical protein